MSKKIDISRESLCGLYVNKKLSSSEIGRMFNCDTTVILSRLRRFGIPVRNRGTVRKLNIKEKQLQVLYINEKLSSSKIGKILGCNNITVIERLKEFRIPIRSNSEAHKGHPAYNKKIEIKQAELFDLYVVKKLSSVEIGKVFKCHAATVLDRLREFGIPVRLGKLKIKRAELHSLYTVKKLGLVAIGRILNCNIAVIWSRLREFGIPVRTLREAHKDTLTKEQIRNILRRRIPSCLEKQFQNIINKHNLPYKYVGNGKFFVERFNPDFINTTSEKVAIEVYARYYKLKRPESIEEWKKKRAEVFKSYGWKLLFFDETEISEKNVLGALRSKKAKES